MRQGYGDPGELKPDDPSLAPCTSPLVPPPSPLAPRILVSLCTYNERENVVALIPQLLNVAPNADVMLIDDNSPDQTADEAEQLFAVHPRFSVLRRKSERGYGRSLLEGYRTAVDREY